MTTTKLARFFLAVALAAAIAPLAWADSWAPPSTKTTPSSDGQFRVTVVPRPLGGALDFFKDKVDGKKSAGQRKGDSQTSPLARVERRGPSGAWQMVWQKPLVNDVGPVRVLLANQGTFLVTFDNWHSAGYGDDVVVIYDSHGNLVRKLSVEQILPPAYSRHLSRSVSSRWWGGEHRLVEGERLLELQIIEPGLETPLDQKYVPLRVRLADGVVLPESGAAWTRALAKANKLETERLAAWSVHRKTRVLPLVAPASKDTNAWREYMFELSARIEREDEDMIGMLLSAPGAEPSFHTDKMIAAWVRSYDAKDQFRRNSIIFASAASAKLAGILTTQLAARPAGSMKGVHIAFVGTPEEGSRVAKAGKHAGAKVTLVDRTRPFRAGKPLPVAPPDWFVVVPGRG